MAAGHNPAHERLSEEEVDGENTTRALAPTPARRDGREAAEGEGDGFRDHSLRTRSGRRRRP